MYILFTVPGVLTINITVCNTYLRVLEYLRKLLLVVTNGASLATTITYYSVFVVLMTVCVLLNEPIYLIIVKGNYSKGNTRCGIVK